MSSASTLLLPEQLHAQLSCTADICTTHSRTPAATCCDLTVLYARASRCHSLQTILVSDVYSHRLPWAFAAIPAREVSIHVTCSQHICPHLCVHSQQLFCSCCSHYSGLTLLTQKIRVPSTLAHSHKRPGHVKASQTVSICHTC